MPSGIYKRNIQTINRLKLLGFKRGYTPWNKGKKLSLSTRKKMSQAKQNDKHWYWKGDKASYATKHQWVINKKGKALVCVKCGATKWVHWSNKDHKYKRNLEDYVALCPTCHKKYDLKNNLCSH